jgi:DNA-binding NarL/FixJ family response regulator
VKHQLGDPEALDEPEGETAQFVGVVEIERSSGSAMVSAAAELPLAGAVTVLLVDGDTPSRSRLRSLLQASSEIVVVGEARTGLEACAQVIALQPKVVLLNSALSGLGSNITLRKFRDECPGASILMLGSADDEAGLVASVRAGASGYLPRESSRELLVHAVQAVALGVVAAGG